MPAQDVSVSAEFEPDAPSPTSVELSLKNATDVVQNIKEPAAEISVPLNVAMEWSDDDQTDTAEIKWTVTGVEGIDETAVTADAGNKTATLKIPAEVTKPGTISVKATVGKTESKELKIRLDGKLVETTGKTTKVYVAADTAVITSTANYSPFDLLSGETMTGAVNGKMDAFTELVVTRASSTGEKPYDYRATPMLDFDLTNANLTKLLEKAYSAELVITGAGGYEPQDGKGNARTTQNTASVIDVWAAGATKVSNNIAAIDGTFAPSFTYKYAAATDGKGKDISDQTGKINILSALKTGTNIKDNHLYVSIGEQKPSGYRTSIMSRENMKAGNRGAYIEIVEGNTVTFNATGITNANATLTIKNQAGDKTIGTVELENGKGTILLPAGTYKYSMGAGLYKEIEDAEFTVVDVDSDTPETNQVPVQIENNPASPASLKISYRTDAAQANTEVKSVDVTLSADKQFVNQEVTLDAKYFGTQLVDSGLAAKTEATNKFRAYTVTTGIDGGKVTLSETGEDGKLEVENKGGTFENTAIVVVDDTDDTAYYYYEDFSGLTANTLTAAGWTTNGTFTVKDDGEHKNVLVQTGDQKGAHATFKAGTFAATDISGNITFSADAVLKCPNTTKTLALTLYTAENWSGGSPNYGVVEDKSIFTLENAGTNYYSLNGEQITTEGLTVGDWFHIDADCDFTNKMVHVVIKSTDGNTTYYTGDVEMMDTSATAPMGMWFRSVGTPENVKFDNIKIKEYEGTIAKLNYLTVNTAPYAHVTLTGASGAVNKQADADINGKAVFKGTNTTLPVAEDYTVTATSDNKYLKETTTSGQSVAAATNTDVDLPMDFEDTYNNMLYGDDFEVYADKLTLISGESAGADDTTKASAPVVKGQGAKLGVWSLATQANLYDRLIVRGSAPAVAADKTNGPGCDPTLAKGKDLTMLDGNFLYASFFRTGDNDATVSSAVWEAKVNDEDNIDSIKLDVCLDGLMGNDIAKVGMNDVEFRYGDTTLFTLTANASGDGAALTNMGIKIGDTETVVSGEQGTWVHIEITGLTSETANVKVTKYDGTELGSETQNANVTVSGQSKSFTLNSVDKNSVGSMVKDKQTYAGAGIAIDNLEIYKAAGE